MKKSLALFVSLLSLSAFAEGPQFDNLSKDDVEDVSREFGANFSHTAVAAPETPGLWGVEVGIIGGVTDSPEFKDTVEKSGGDGKDFESIYHGGAMARVHFPFELFAEMTYLPEIKVEDVKADNTSFAVGWNFGRFFNLPLDIAIGANRANGNVSFKQEVGGVPANVELETTSTAYWLGVSKRFFGILTPYAKIGSSQIEGELNSTASILGYTSAEKEDVSLSGAYYAAGLNVELLFIRLGAEFSQTQDVQKLTGKLSFSF